MPDSPYVTVKVTEEKPREPKFVRVKITPGSINVDPVKWTRLAEVEQYAEAHGVNLEQAVIELVNKGLDVTAGMAK